MMTTTPTELLPVHHAVFQIITATNASFEKLTADLHALQQFNFFPGEKLHDRLNTVCLIRAEINLLLMEALRHREMTNALYYDRLCCERERELRDPDDVLLEAEHRKQQLAEQQTPTEPERPQPEIPQENPA